MIVNTKKRRLVKGIEFESTITQRDQTSLGLETISKRTLPQKADSRDESSKRNLSEQSDGLPPLGKESETLSSMVLMGESNKKIRKTEPQNHPIVNNFNSDSKAQRSLDIAMAENTNTNNTTTHAITNLKGNSDATEDTKGVVSIGNTKVNTNAEIPLLAFAIDANKSTAPNTTGNTIAKIDSKASLTTNEVENIKGNMHAGIALHAFAIEAKTRNKETKKRNEVAKADKMKSANVKDSKKTNTGANKNEDPNTHRDLSGIAVVNMHTDVPINSNVSAAKINTKGNLSVTVDPNRDKPIKTNEMGNPKENARVNLTVQVSATTSNTHTNINTSPGTKEDANTSISITAPNVGSTTVKADKKVALDSQLNANISKSGIASPNINVSPNLDAMAKNANTAEVKPTSNINAETNSNTHNNSLGVESNNTTVKNPNTQNAHANTKTSTIVNTSTANTNTVLTNTKIHVGVNVIENKNALSDKTATVNIISETNTNGPKKSQPDSILFGFVAEVSESKKPSDLGKAVAEKNQKESKRSVFEIPPDIRVKESVDTPNLHDGNQHIQMAESISLTKASLTESQRKPSINVITKKEEKAEFKPEMISEILSESALGLIRRRGKTLEKNINDKKDRDARKAFMEAAIAFNFGGGKSEIKSKPHSPSSEKENKASLIAQVLVPPPQGSNIAAKRKQSVVQAQLSLYSFNNSC